MLFDNDFTHPVLDGCFHSSQGNVDSVTPNEDEIPDEDDDVAAERSRVKDIFDHSGQNEVSMEWSIQSKFGC